MKAKSIQNCLTNLTCAALLLVLLLLAGCAAPMNKNFYKVHAGMTRQQVIELLGTPTSAAGTTGHETLFFRLASSFMDTDGSDTREYFVTLTNGAVSEYGERNDPVTKERARRQYEAAWQSFEAASKSLQANQESLDAWAERQRQISQDFQKQWSSSTIPTPFFTENTANQTGSANRAAKNFNWRGDEILLPSIYELNNPYPTGRVKMGPDGTMWKEYRTESGIAVWSVDR